MDIEQFWKAVLSQDRDGLKTFFHDNASVNWHCTNERFTVDEYIKANCDYPGEWDGHIERVERFGQLWITVTCVYSKAEKSSSFHVVSFFMTHGQKIMSLDEYWADDGEAPLWRQKMNIGQALKIRNA